MTENEGEQAADKPPAKRTRLKRSTKKAPAEKPSEKATEKAAADEPTSTPEESADKPADKPADKSAEKPTAAATTTTATKTEPKEKKKRSSKSVGATARQAFDLTRDRIGRIVGLVCLLAAAFLAVGALLIALRSNINGDNSVVRFIIDVADVVDGPLSRANGIFHFDGKNAMTKNALVNWGLAAIVWLIVGRILSRLIRP